MWGKEIESFPLLRVVDAGIEAHKKAFEKRRMRWDKGYVTGIGGIRTVPSGSAMKMASGYTTGKRTEGLYGTKKDKDT